MTLDELAGLAEKATPGPYLHHREFSPGQIHSMHIPDGQSACIAPLVAETSTWSATTRQQVLANADFIAACDPGTVLKLIAVARLLEELHAMDAYPEDLWWDRAGAAIAALDGTPVPEKPSCQHPRYVRGRVYSVKSAEAKCVQCGHKADGWHCPKSASGLCSYEKYGMDRCDHCGQPEERK